MASTEFELDQFVQGNLIAWNITTQCGCLPTVKLVAGDKTFFTMKKTTWDNNLQLLGNGSATIDTAESLKLVITIPQSMKIKSSIVAGAISDKKAKKVGYIYDICIEDSDDNDYNDVYVNIVGWKNQAT